MCGIAGVVGKATYDRSRVGSVQHHRGPDFTGYYEDLQPQVLLCHNRLSIIDLSVLANQPLTDVSGRYVIVFNGEVYNYLELRNKLDYPFQSRGDTEVVLASYMKWGAACLDQFVGMFAFAIWDKQEKELFAARDRFGVKPFHYAVSPDGFVFGSEIKALFELGIPRTPDEQAWSTYLVAGMYDHDQYTFWKGVSRLLPGHCLWYSESAGLRTRSWYDLSARVSSQGTDDREEKLVTEELRSLLLESVKLRFRSDVPVGILLSGGVDSSLLWGLINKAIGNTDKLNTFTFYTDDPAYDERPWVRELLGTVSPSNHFIELRHQDVPALATSVMSFQEEPFGGFPTLAFSLLHQRARERGITVLLDGNGIDEGWAGYDYYQRAGEVNLQKGPVQASQSDFDLQSCLTAEFKHVATPFAFPSFAGDAMRNVQMRDLMFAKIPRAMRFADRVSMMYSRELREPFLDHRIVELGLRQPDHRKIRNGVRKYLVRKAGEGIIKGSVLDAIKRPVQTPQREWLRRELREWTDHHIDHIIQSAPSGWLHKDSVQKLWAHYCNQPVDNSFPVWQLISLSLMLESKP